MSTRMRWFLLAAAVAVVAVVGPASRASAAACTG